MNKRLVRPTLVWLIILVILPLPLLWLLNAGLTDSFHNLLIYDLGLLAYTYWLIIVYLSTRPKWLERWLGLPKMYLVHGLLGVCALALALLHSQLSFSMQRWVVLTGWLALYLAIGGVFYAAFFLSGWLVDYSPRAAKLKKRLQRPLQPPGLAVAAPAQLRGNCVDLVSCSLDSPALPADGIYHLL